MSLNKTICLIIGLENEEIISMIDNILVKNISNFKN